MSYLVTNFGCTIIKNALVLKNHLFTVLMSTLTDTAIAHHALLQFVLMINVEILVFLNPALIFAGHEIYLLEEQL